VQTSPQLAISLRRPLLGLGLDLLASGLALVGLLVLGGAVLTCTLAGRAGTLSTASTLSISFVITWRERG
jgi:hypothetical protein